VLIPLGWASKALAMFLPSLRGLMVAKQISNLVTVNACHYARDTGGITIALT